MLEQRPIWPSLVLMRTFVKIFFRDKQSIFFSIFFPIVFMLALGMPRGDNGTAIAIGVSNQVQTAVAEELVRLIQSDANFEVFIDVESELEARLASREIAAFVTISQVEGSIDKIRLEILVDSAQLGSASNAIDALRQRADKYELKLRQLEPIMDISVDDVQSRSMRYIDFLLPGLLAFSIMQMGIAGSGFNLVEYRRKGILKRLFVTPVRPLDVVVGLVGARLLLVLLQISVLLAIAVQFLEVEIMGSFLSMYFVACVAAVVFLSIGFALGSIAKTQASIQALGNLVIFPQMFFSGMFFPISSLPEVFQPIANILPLSFVASAMRGIVAYGHSLLYLLQDLVGIVVWLIIALVCATHLFKWRDIASS